MVAKRWSQKIYRDQIVRWSPINIFSNQIMFGRLHFLPTIQFGFQYQFLLATNRIFGDQNSVWSSIVFTDNSNLVVYIIIYQRPIVYLVTKILLGRLQFLPTTVVWLPISSFISDQSYISDQITFGLLYFLMTIIVWLPMGSFISDQIYIWSPMSIIYYKT